MILEIKYKFSFFYKFKKGKIENVFTTWMSVSEIKANIVMRRTIAINTLEIILILNLF